MMEKLKVSTGFLFPFGASPVYDGINFSMICEDGRKGSLVLREKKTGETVELEFPKEDPYSGNIRCMKITGIEPSKIEYQFKVEGKAVKDRYGKQISGRREFGKEDTEELYFSLPENNFDWENDKSPELSFDDMILYKLHVRGFTKSASSAVKCRGTFRGLEEKIPYLKELGINAVELMPVYEFDEIIKEKNTMYFKEDQKKKINYWGYGKGYYFAPKTSYAWEKDRPCRELKELVRTLHRNGIEIILEFYFVPGTYQGLILECLRFWVQEYHIDGVHLNEECINQDILVQDPVLAKTKILGNWWRTGSDGRKGKEKYLAECNDGFMSDMRKFLKGNEGVAASAAFRLKRNPSGLAVINYMAGHNGFTLQDMISYDRKHNEDNGENNRDGTEYNDSWNCGVEGKTKSKRVLELRERQRKNAILLLLLSQGVPMIMAGDEMCRTQNGNNNAYCQDNSISWMNWKRKETEEEFFQFVKEMIAFRKKHPVFHQQEELRGMDYLSCGYPDFSFHGEKAWYADMEVSSRQFGVMYYGQYATDRSFYVAYNLHWEKHSFALPALPKGIEWKVAVDTSKKKSILGEGREVQLEDQKRIEVPPRTIVVLVG